MPPAHTRTQDISPGEDIAIVGMACIFPGADSLEKYWQNILGQVDCVSDPPPKHSAEWRTATDPRSSEPVYASRGGFLGDLCRFDPTRFGVLPASVDGGEPDQYLALRCAFEALADAGVPQLPLNRQRTAVIMGRGAFINRGLLAWINHGAVVDQVLGLLRVLEPDRGEQELAALAAELKRNLPPFTSESVPGLAHSVLVGRIANRLDLMGPAYTLDAACSSSLLAVEHGIRELRSGHCDAVLAGGVQVSTPALIYQTFCKIGAPSRSGRIAPFSATADGTLLGEGCGILVLKRRSDAERDGNRIYAVVKEVGVSSDGNGAGILAPRTEGQQLAMRRAYEQAGLSTGSIALLEAHGTGIPLGDQTEMNSLVNCFGGRDAEGPRIALGSVKSMLGHLIPASGAASLIKVALSLYHRTLPPMLHAETPHPGLGLEKTPFYLSTQTRPWIHGAVDSPRRAGVNAFGFGGINTHAILEEHQAADETTLPRLEKEWPVELVVVSAPDRASLPARLNALAGWLEQASGVSLLDVAAACSAEPGVCRVAIVVQSLDDLKKKLLHVARLLEQPERQKIQDRSGLFWYAEPPGATGRVAFLFPGEGAQYAGMLGELCRHFPEVRREFDLTDLALTLSDANLPLSRHIYPPPGLEQGADADLLDLQGAVVAVTAASRALLALMGRLGIQADAVLGHSSGEYGALLAAGVYDLSDEEERVRMIGGGARNAVRLASSGLVPEAVLTTIGGADRGAVERVLAGSGGRLTIAVDNCPSQLVLAGDEAASAAAVAALQGKGGLCQRLPWGRAYHTEAFTPACAIVAEYFQTLHFRKPRRELWSCASVSVYPEDPEAVRELAIRQWRTPVRFRETIQAMHEAGVRVFVEVGPRGNLSAFVSDTLGKQPHLAIRMDVPRKGGIEQLCRAVGMLVAAGVSVNLAELYHKRSPRLLDLSATPPKPPRVQPPLSQVMPELKVSEAVARRWQISRQPAASQPTASQPVNGSVRTAAAASPASSASPGAALVPPVGPASAAISPLADPQSLVLPQPGQLDLTTSGNGETRAMDTATAVPWRSAISPGTDFRARALAEYQQTMRQFLDAQERVGLARFKPRPARMIKARDGQNPGACHDQQAPVPRWESRPLPIAVPAPVAVSVPASALASVSAPASMASPALAPVKTAHTTGQASAPDPTHGGSLAHPVPAAEWVPVHAPAAPAIVPRPLPYLETILFLEPGSRLSAECELDVSRHLFLSDHTFFGRQLSVSDPTLSSLPIMPLAMTLELLAEAAVALRPGLTVVALRDVRTFRWVPFETPTRRVRLEAKSRDDSLLVDVAAYEADRDGTGGMIAEAEIELAELPVPLGEAVVADTATTPFAWPQSDIYEWMLINGPALQGINSIDACDPHGVRASLRPPEPSLLRPIDRPGALVLPASAIDLAGQLIGLQAVHSLDGDHLPVIYPNHFASLELGPLPPAGASLVGIARVDMSEAEVDCDVEIKDADGGVLLRILGWRHERVRLPRSVYSYWSAPRQIVLSEMITEQFQGIPGVDSCAVTAIDMSSGRVLLQRLWSQVLARMILGREERRLFGELKLPPLAAVSWLLGRAAVKDAVRALLRGVVHGRRPCPLRCTRGATGPAARGNCAGGQPGAQGLACRGHRRRSRPVSRRGDRHRAAGSHGRRSARGRLRRVRTPAHRGGGPHLGRAGGGLVPFGLVLQGGRRQGTRPGRRRRAKKS